MTALLTIIGPGAERDAAALLHAARLRGTPMRGARLAAPGDALLPADARSFVTQDGALRPNEGYWVEWGAGPPVADAAPLLLACPDPATALPHGTPRQAAAPRPSDAFGRPLLPQPERSGMLRIGLLGGMRHLTDNPAALAALGDAADRIGLPVQPVELPPDGPLPPGLAGLLLPGGSDMASVPAQHRAALAALESGLPVLGLCLGMQSMATALARRAGWPDAASEETAGPGQQRSFVRLHGADGRPRHRLGEVLLTPAPGTRLAALAPGGLRVRCNHRYALAPEVPMPRGIVVHRCPDGIAEALEATDHPFYLGLQGHPELGWDPGVAQLWDGFLRAAAGR